MRGGDDDDASLCRSSKGHGQGADRSTEPRASPHTAHTTRRALRCGTWCAVCGRSPGVRRTAPQREPWRAACGRGTLRAQRFRAARVAPRAPMSSSRPTPAAFGGPRARPVVPDAPLSLQPDPSSNHRPDVRMHTLKTDRFPSALIGINIV